MKNFFFHSSSIYQKLFKFQKKIQETERKNPRFCRNFQRRLYRSSSIQLLILNEILQLQLKRPRKKGPNCPTALLHCAHCGQCVYASHKDPLQGKRGSNVASAARGQVNPCIASRYPSQCAAPLRKERGNFQEINGIYQSGFSNQYPIIFSKLISKEYRYFLTRQIFNILWVLALSPILDNKKKDHIILTGLKGSKIYPTIYTFLKKPFIQYITISQFSNFFNRKNKYWILSNLLIEKKFFLNWLKLDQRSTILGNNSLLFSLGLKDKTISDEFTLQSENDPWQLQFLAPKKKLDPLSLKTTLENFVNLSFSDFLHMLEFINPNILSLPSGTKATQVQDLCYHPLPSRSLHDAIRLCARTRNGRVQGTGGHKERGAKVNAKRLCFAQTNAPIAQFWQPLAAEGLHSVYSFIQTHRNKKMLEGIDSQKFSNLKTRLKIKPSPRCVVPEGARNGQVRIYPTANAVSHKRLAILHKFNNIDLKKGTVVNAITSISHQLSVPKDILPSLFPTSKFLYFDLIKQIGFLNQSCFKLAKKIQQPKQPPIRSFYKHLMEYNGLILLALKKKRALRFSHNSLNYYAQIHGLKIKFIKFYALDQGLHFLGWFFQKKNHSFEGFISHKNIYNHQKELKHCLKTSENKPMDKIIYELNQKIIRWQKCYNCSIQFSKTCSQLDRKSKLNDDLFWFIWRWIKKRHSNRGSKWLYTRYWKKSTSRRWIFSAHQHTLIFYIR